MLMTMKLPDMPSAGGSVGSSSKVGKKGSKSSASTDAKAPSAPCTREWAQFRWWVFVEADRASADDVALVEQPREAEVVGEAARSVVASKAVKVEDVRHVGEGDGHPA